jgi:hypothetical protein
MNKNLRLQLIVVLLALLMVVVAAWWLLMQPRRVVLPNLVGITYTPPPGSPIFAYHFSAPVSLPLAGGNSALLVDFTPSASQDYPAYARALVEVQKGYPFAPSLSDPATITSNTAPKGLGVFSAPIAITGQGSLVLLQPRSG